MNLPSTAPEQEFQDSAWAAFERGDYSTAFANFSALLPTDDTYTLDALGWMLSCGKGCSKDLSKSALFFRQSADLGSQYGLRALGDVLQDSAWAAFERGDYSTAFANFSALLPTDDAYILGALGWMREMGEGCSKNLDEAALFYRQSANGGSQYGLRRLGDVFRDIGKKDEARAVYEEGALQGFTSSMWRLGRMLIEDGSCSDEKERGVKLLRDAAAKGSIFARRTLLGLEMSNSTSIIRKAWIGLLVLRLVISAIPQFVRNPQADEVM